MKDIYCVSELQDEPDIIVQKFKRKRMIPLRNTEVTEQDGSQLYRVL